MHKCTIPLQHPFMMTVCGPTQCGKTRFIMDLIKQNDELIVPPVDKLLYLYSIEQTGYDDIKKNIRDNADTSTLTLKLRMGSYTTPSHLPVLFSPFLAGLRVDDAANACNAIWDNFALLAYQTCKSLLEI